MSRILFCFLGSIPLRCYVVPSAIFDSVEVKKKSRRRRIRKRKIRRYLLFGGYTVFLFLKIRLMTV